MPSFADHPSTKIVKLLIASDSGTGKTGGLASLIDAGYKLRVLDFDNGLSTLRGYVKKKENFANVHYVELADEMKLMGGKVGITKAVAFQRAMEALSKGTKDYWGEDFGPIETWPEDVICVMDTLSSAGKAALNQVLQLNGKGFNQPEIQHYGTAMDNVEKMVQIMTSDSVRCNVIINTHLTGSKENSARLYPEALGDKLPPKMGRYFDNMIGLSISGGKKTYKTQKDGLFPCKTSIPMDAEYPLETGLLTIFEKLKKG